MSEPLSPDIQKDKAHYHGHRERLRQRFLTAGPSAIADYELLELILFGALPQGDVKPLAKRLIDRFGRFADVLAATPEELMGEKGVKLTAAALIKTVEAAAIRMARENVLNRPVLSNWQAVLDYCHIAMVGEKVELFRLLFLNKKNVLIADEVLQRGTIDNTPVYPREVVKRALELSASALILVHNHPSGDPSPSKADIEMTRNIQRAVAPVGIVIHDHLVVGRNSTASFKSLGLL